MSAQGANAGKMLFFSCFGSRTPNSVPPPLPPRPRNQTARNGGAPNIPPTCWIYPRAAQNIAGASGAPPGKHAPTERRAFPLLPGGFAPSAGFNERPVAPPRP